MKIKCFEPHLTQEDADSLSRCLSTRELAFGSMVTDFEKRYTLFAKKQHNIAVSSASAAAWIVFAFLREKHGICNVYTPSLTFSSPVWAAAKHGHNIIFVDVDDNLLFDSEDYRERRAPSGTNVVMPMLYGGVSTIPNLDLVGDEIVVVDSAHCIAPKLEYDYAFFSFHPVKPVCMSQGGLIATDHTDFAMYAMRYRNFGRENIGDSYDIVQDGFKFYMTNLNAALGLGQLERCVFNALKRKKNFVHLKNNVNAEFVDHDSDSSFYLATIKLLTESQDSATVRKRLKEKEVQATFHYPPLHKMTAFREFTVDNLSNTEKLQSKILNIPIHQNLTLEQIEYVVESLEDILDETKAA